MLEMVPAYDYRGKPNAAMKKAMAERPRRVYMSYSDGMWQLIDRYIKARAPTTRARGLYLQVLWFNRDNGAKDRGTYEATVEFRGIKALLNANRARVATKLKRWIKDNQETEQKIQDMFQQDRERKRARKYQ